MIRVAMATEPASPDHPNEDFVGATANGIVLLDGAGSAGLETGCVHGVAWFAHQLGAQLLARLNQTDVDLRAILGESINAVAIQHIHSCDLGHPSTPSATVILVRVTTDRLEYLVLADSVLLVVGHDGAVEAISDQRETRISRRLRAKLDATSHDTAEYGLVLDEHLIALREWRNRPGGFWVAAADPDAAVESITGTCMLPRAAVLLTDGVGRLVDRFHQATWGELFSCSETAGPAEVIRRVRAAERSDPLGRRWSRGKPFDDATIAHCNWTHVTAFDQP